MRDSKIRSTHLAVLHVLFVQGMFFAQLSEGQSVPGGDLKFEVASVKPVPVTANLRSKTPTLTGDRVSGVGPISEFLQHAYKIEAREIAGPDWILFDRFEIDAVTTPGTTLDGAMAMLRALLAERFSLQFHWSDKQVDGYLLTIAPEGFKPKPITPVPGRYAVHVNLRGGKFGATAVPFSRFVNAFSYNVIGAPIEDRTGISGSYTFELEWPVDPDGPAITEPQADSRMLKLVGDSVGLQFTKQRVTLKMLNIDHIERKPTPN